MQGKHWALGQLVLSRVREFYREPEAVFWQEYVAGRPEIDGVLVHVGGDDWFPVGLGFAVSGPDHSFDDVL